MKLRIAVMFLGSINCLYASNILFGVSFENPYVGAGAFKQFGSGDSSGDEMYVITRGCDGKCLLDSGDTYQEPTPTPAQAEYQNTPATQPSIQIDDSYSLKGGAPQGVATPVGISYTVSFGISGIDSSKGGSGDSYYSAPGTASWMQFVIFPQFNLPVVAVPSATTPEPVHAVNTAPPGANPAVLVQPEDRPIGDGGRLIDTSLDITPSAEIPEPGTLFLVGFAMVIGPMVQRRKRIR